MRPSERLNAHREQVRAIVAAHRAANPRVFDSVARGEDTDTSDLDILVESRGKLSLFDIGAIYNELTELLGVEVDVLTANALPDKFRERVIAEAVPI
jgi:predicted nucleotidyltransferase